MVADYMLEPNPGVRCPRSQVMRLCACMPVDESWSVWVCGCVGAEDTCKAPLDRDARGQGRERTGTLDAP